MSPSSVRVLYAVGLTLRDVADERVHTETARGACEDSHSRDAEYHAYVGESGTADEESEPDPDSS